jgi:hypothetical protein
MSAEVAVNALNMSLLHDQKGTELGAGASATAAGAIAIGTNMTESVTGGAAATAANAVQLGAGHNETPNSVKHQDKYLASVIVASANVSVGNTTPAHIGQIFVNPAGSKVYVAKATSSPADFLVLN